MSELDPDLIIKIAISVSTLLIGTISVLAFWLRVALTTIFDKTISELRTEIKSCQEKINIRVDQIDEYGQKNREISYKAKDGIAAHVEKFHTK